MAKNDLPHVKHNVERVGQDERIKIIMRAQEGDSTALPGLLAIYKKDESGYVELIGNTAAFVERDLMSSMFGKNLAVKEALKPKLSQLRKGLGGQNPSPIERPLTERAVFVSVIRIPS